MAPENFLDNKFFDLLRPALPPGIQVTKINALRLKNHKYMLSLVINTIVCVFYFTEQDARLWEVAVATGNHVRPLK